MNDGATDSARRALVIREMLVRFQRAIGAPERCRCPVIAAIHGPVIGLGIDLISYCDIRYAASDATFVIKVLLSPTNSRLPTYDVLLTRKSMLDWQRILERLPSCPRSLEIIHLCVNWLILRGHFLLSRRRNLAFFPK
jgi:Enoyl-CoA hydratase/isomerase